LIDLLEPPSEQEFHAFSIRVIAFCLELLQDLKELNCALSIHLYLVVLQQMLQHSCLGLHFLVHLKQSSAEKRLQSLVDDSRYNASCSGFDASNLHRSQCCFCEIHSVLIQHRENYLFFDEKGGGKNILRL